MLPHGAWPGRSPGPPGGRPARPSRDRGIAHPWALLRGRPIGGAVLPHGAWPGRSRALQTAGPVRESSSERALPEEPAVEDGHGAEVAPVVLEDRGDPAGGPGPDV